MGEGNLGGPKNPPPYPVKGLKAGANGEEGLPHAAAPGPEAL